MDHPIATTLSRLAPLTLAALNAKAAMLERQDNKYILPAGRLLPALDAFTDLFDANGLTSHLPWLWWLLWLAVAAFATVMFTVVRVFAQ